MKKIQVARSQVVAVDTESTEYSGRVILFVSCQSLETGQKVLHAEVCVFVHVQKRCFSHLLSPNSCRFLNQDVSPQIVKIKVPIRFFTDAKMLDVVNLPFVGWIEEEEFAEILLH